MLRSTSLLSRAAAVIAAATLIAACGSGSHKLQDLCVVPVRDGQRSHHVAGCGKPGDGAVRSTACALTGSPASRTRWPHPHAFKQAFNTNSPAFGSAMGHCQQLLPSGGPSGQNQARSQRQINAMLAFARCMRGHGFSRFPDPTSNGSVTHQMIAQAGIDLHQPALVRAADTCTAVTHGVAHSRRRRALHRRAVAARGEPWSGETIAA